MNSICTDVLEKCENKAEIGSKNVITANPACSLLKDFLYNDKPVRCVIKDDEIWFVATDVCKAMEIQNPTQAVSRLDEDERSMFNIGRQGEAAIINEPGLYSLVLGSRKPEAKEFKRWVTHEVIPSIRKHDGYIVGQDELTNEEFLAKAYMVAQRVIEERTAKLREAEQQIIRQQEENSKLKNINGYLAKEICTWDGRNIVSALIRALAVGRFRGDFVYAYNTFYKELRYKKGIEPKKRSGKGNFFDRIRDDEWNDVVQVAVALCENSGIDVASVINEENAKIKESV